MLKSTVEIKRCHSTLIYTVRMNNNLKLIKLLCALYRVFIVSNVVCICDHVLQSKIHIYVRIRNMLSSYPYQFRSRLPFENSMNK